MADIAISTLTVAMRDSTRLATDLYLPPDRPAPVIVMRTPYGRGGDRMTSALMSFARRGFAVAAQDCRGTGASEPDRWDYYMFEAEDGFDCVEWVALQPWCNGFIGACGGSYVGQTQWAMAMHPAMSAIAPEVSGLGVARNTTQLHMPLNAYARSVGKGAGRIPIPYTELEAAMLDETLAGGLFNEPLEREFPPAIANRLPDLAALPRAEATRALWRHYCSLTGAERVQFARDALEVDEVDILAMERLATLYDHMKSHDAHTVPSPDPIALAQALEAPPLMITGWYDWALNDALATFQLVRAHARPSVASRTRLIVAPNAHNVPGYHEGMAADPALQHAHRTPTQVELLLEWYRAVASGRTGDWPTVIYYLMGANDWQTTASWPPSEANPIPLYLGAGGVLQNEAPVAGVAPDLYTYDPLDPTPTIGGSILSNVYAPGSVDVSGVQGRSDVLVFTTAPLEDDLDVVGPLSLVLYASTSAVDTDFVARLSDVFPDGRAIQLQSGILRARYRDDPPALLEPGQVYRFSLDLWATANRFRRGHRLRLDISSADFPRFDRNANLGGEAGPPRRATQTVYHDGERPSHLLLSVLGRSNV